MGKAGAWEQLDKEVAAPRACAVVGGVYSGRGCGCFVPTVRCIDSLASSMSESSSSPDLLEFKHSSISSQNIVQLQDSVRFSC